ncbi:MAG: porin family protein [Bacteroidia bacterium]
MHKSFYTILILIFVATAANAQRTKVENQPKYDKARIHFGFSLGINKADFRVRKSPDLFQFDSLYNVDNLKQTGFNLGIVMNLRMGEHFDLRFIPDLAFVERDLEYTFYLNGKQQKPSTLKKIESTFLDFPLYVKFKSERVGNFRAYVLAGGQYSIDMVSQAKVENEDKQFVKLKKKDYGYTIGVGLDFYLEMFKFSPEFKMYNGLDNLLVPDNTIFARSLSGLNSKIFMVSLLFE